LDNYERVFLQSHKSREKIAKR